MVLVMQSCGMCFDAKHAGGSAVFKAGKGYRYSLAGNLRFSGFLCARPLKRCYCSKHESVEKRSDEVDAYGFTSTSDRPKVSVTTGYDDLPYFVGNEDGTERFDVSLACKIFPSIVVGSSPPVTLYDGTTDFGDMKSLVAPEGYQDILLSSSNEEKTPKRGRDRWDLSEIPILSVETSLATKPPPYLPQLSVDPMKLVADEKQNKPVVMDDSVSLESRVDVELFLDSAISCIPGLKPRDHRLLEESGFHTLRKLLHHFPRTYADLQNAQIGIEDGQYLISMGEVKSSRGVRVSCSLSYLEVVVSCEITERESKSKNTVDTKESTTIHLHLMKFFRGTRFTNYYFLRKLQDNYKVGETVCVSGKVRTLLAKNHYEIKEYSIEIIRDEIDSSFHAKARPYPIYSARGGSKPSFLRDIMPSALTALPILCDPIPKDALQDFGLPSLYEAYIGIHQPKNINEAGSARRRFIFDEFFYLQLGRLFQMLEGLGTQIERERLLDRYRKPVENAAYMQEWSSLTKLMVKALPYSLTSSQLKAVSEIIWDLKQPVSMNRLLQGDVGCGKTIVAFLACMEVISSGYQAAFMVPTELLAIQHYENLNKLLESMGDVECKPSIALLTGSTPIKQSRMILKDLQTGDISMIVGTHRLISENVEFSALRIAVVDEQHRFGVIQRGRLNNKLCNFSASSRVATETLDETSQSDNYMAPHILAMSATPIPRTLALALYGDVSLTQITDLPPGRLPVETLTVEGSETGFENVYKIMLDELEGGGKLFIIYPVIDQSEQLPQLRAAATDFESISQRFQAYGCGLLHGRMKGDEKEEALKRFRCGETPILLSTQVIEVGVDVPDASLMVVMNAERFGIAQLHQLRGRVGRGSKKSRCIFVASTANSLNRLKVLEKSSDGFYLANVDLSLRGPGDLLGKKQSGHLPEFPVARLEIDGNIIQEAQTAALRILGASHDLEKFPLLKMELSMRQPLSFLGD